MGTKNGKCKYRRKKYCHRGKFTECSRCGKGFYGKPTNNRGWLKWKPRLPSAHAPREMAGIPAE